MLYWKGMERGSSERSTELPEKLVDRLRRHLKRHALWDSLLIFPPPILVFFYFMFFLYRSRLIAQETVIFASVAALGIALLIGISRHHSMAHLVRLAPRLIDDRVEGKDRFVTLATIDPSFYPSFLVDRLRHEAAGLGHRLDLKRDFRYRVKRSFLDSLIGSLIIVLLFHLFLQIIPFFASKEPHANELTLLAKKLSQVPRYSELARSIEALAARMQEKGLTDAEKRSMIQETLKKLEKQRAAERQQGGAGDDLSNQTANALRKLEKGLEGSQEEGEGGGIKSNLPQQGEGKGKESSKGSGEGQGESAILGSKDLKGDKSLAGNKNEPGQGQGESDKGEGEKVKREGEKRREMEGMAKGELEQKGGKSKMSEEIPRGAPPAERFQQPGEQGEKGLKGSRFVTVQLPEEEAQGSTGKGGSGKRKELQPKVPVSNTPLPRSAGPDAASEKQPVPLEYRRLIR
ncbi:MAG: hypothetical protein ACREQA_23615 [Candidatus Binatia bacterium]